jgi:ABC-type antimicrobial peptide transport system permease subunit
MRLVIRHGALLAAVGGVGGVLLAVPAARLVAGMLYGVPITDALTYTVVLATVGGAVLLATAIPARRAAGSDPATALRAE